MNEKTIFKSVFVLGIIVCVTLISFLVYATPRLGVATDTGMYVYLGDTVPTDNYINYFANSFKPAGTSGDEGFVLGTSGSTVTVFTTYNPATTPVYLVAATGGQDLSMSYDGRALGDIGVTKKIASYPGLPYYGAVLPSSGWSLEDDPFGDNKDYYFYEAPIVYDENGWADGDYLFAYAPDENPSASPKTASTGGHTPELSTILMMSSGLLGMLGAFRRRS